MVEIVPTCAVQPFPSVAFMPCVKSYLVHYAIRLFRIACPRSISIGIEVCQSCVFMTPISENKRTRSKVLPSWDVEFTTATE